MRICFFALLFVCPQLFGIQRQRSYRLTNEDILFKKCLRNERIQFFRSSSKKELTAPAKSPSQQRTNELSADQFGSDENRERYKLFVHGKAKHGESAAEYAKNNKRKAFTLEREALDLLLQAHGNKKTRGPLTTRVNEAIANVTQGGYSIK